MHFIRKFLFLIFVLIISSFKSVNSKHKPLLLTEFLEKNEINKAKKLSRVKDYFKITSYSGYFTVDKKNNSNIFFWFFPSEDVFKSPLLLWLQGGPGASSMIGLFFENGPLTFDKFGNVKVRNISWCNNNSMLYIDNPVGTGFSYTDKGYSRNVEDVAENLYKALVQFFTLFHEYQNHDFYVTGESYAGKYVIALGYKIDKMNSNTNIKINLKGFAIGNGLIDPISQLKYADFLSTVGLFGKDEKIIGQLYESAMSMNIKNKNYKKAYLLFEDYIGGGQYSNNSYFANVTGFTDYYNLPLRNNINLEKLQKDVLNYLNQDNIKIKIHTGNRKFLLHNHDIVLYMDADFMKSVMKSISYLLKYYRILIYIGQNDIIINYSSSIHYLSKLRSNILCGNDCPARRKLCYNRRLVGYIRTTGNLSDVLVRRAGHMVPRNQPVWSRELINRFTRNMELGCNEKTHIKN